MIENEKRYEFVTSQIRYHNEKVIESFNLFIRLFSGIVAGAVWLSTQSDPSAKHRVIGIFAYVLVIMLMTMTSVTVIANVLQWYGYRRAESGLVGKDKVPPPTVLGSCWNEIAMLLCIISVSAVFCLFNPLAE